MDKHLRILAAVDYSDAARAAFAHALALGRQAPGAELRVVHAVPATDRFGWRGSERAALLAGLREDAARAGVAFSARVQHGDAADTILLHARAWQPDLIVMGTDQPAGWRRLRAGSVAEHVALAAGQPVLTVPRGLPVDAAPRLDRILVAVDFSAASTRAIEHALALAAAAGSRISLVHVVPGFTGGRVPRNLYRFGAVEYQRALTADAWRRLQEAVRPGDPARGAVHARVMTGDPGENIMRAAAEMQAGLIVVGVANRGWLSRTLRSATASQLVRAVPVPLLTVPEHAAAPAWPVAGAGLARAA